MKSKGNKDGNIKSYFYNISSINRVSLTDDRNKSVKIDNSGVLEEVINDLKKTLKDNLVRVYTI